MKGGSYMKNFFHEALFFTLFWVFAGCTNLGNTSSSSSSSTGGSTTTTTATTPATTSGTSTTSAGTSVSWSYTSSSPVYEIGSDVSTVALSGDDLSGKTIYLAKTNASSSAVSASYARYVTGAQNITLTDAETDSESPVPSGPGSAASVTQLSLSVGSTTKSVYVDQDSDISTFAAETATLRACGTYCNVWVVSDCYTSGTASGEKIDSAIAESLASKFDAMYLMIRNVFGDESEKICLYSSGSVTEADMSDYDDTGTSSAGRKVNIVVYDIGNDYGSSSSSGIVGYFYAKDYYRNTGSALASSSGYKVIDYSNCGKYFYVDAYFAVSYTDMVYSTLSHEFQHMIDFGVKDMDKDLSPSTWYNEMLSMLSEDILQSSLGINASDYDDSPENRLPMFNRCYKDCGLEYRSSSTYYEILSYSSAFAFGAWIIRQFGGVPVIAAMSSNDYVDTDSVTAAVNSVNGTSYTMEDLLKMYAEACIFSDTTLGMPTFNRSRTLSASDAYYYSAGSYGYPVCAVDIWNLDDIFSSDFTGEYKNTTYYKYDGPELYGYNAAYSIRPYGMTLVKIGTASADSATITLSTTGKSSEHLYLFVQ